MKTTFMDIMNEYKNTFETKWNMTLCSYLEETMFWASRNKDFTDVAMFVALQNEKYVYVNKENLDKTCFDDFCEVITEHIIIKNILKSAEDKNSDLTEQELVNTYLMTKHLLRPF